MVMVITCEVFIPGCSLNGEMLDVMSTPGRLLYKLDDVLSIKLFVVRTACTDNTTKITATQTFSFEVTWPTVTLRLPFTRILSRSFRQEYMFADLYVFLCIFV